VSELVLYSDWLGRIMFCLLCSYLWYLIP